MDHDGFLMDDLNSEALNENEKYKKSLISNEQTEKIEQAMSRPGRGAVPLIDGEGKYAYATKKEPLWKESDIEVDPESGLRFQMIDVGMTRNAKAENRSRTKVYLDPIPHVVKDQNIPLRGWYQSKFEPPGVRPRPCLLPGSLVDTPFGPKPIEELKKGDIIYGWDFETGKRAETYVQGTASQVKDEYLEIELKNGKTLRLTPDHLVFTRNRGWVEAQNLTLKDDLLPLGVKSKIKRVCGVYGLVNKRNGKINVGSAHNMVRRLHIHFQHLRAGIHCNPYLQAAYDKGDRFTPILLCECSPEDLVSNENKYMIIHNSRDPRFGYNMCEAGMPPQTGKTWVEFYGKEEADRQKKLVVERNKKNKKAKVTKSCLHCNGIMAEDLRYDRKYCDNPECLKACRVNAGVSNGDKVRKPLHHCKQCGDQVPKGKRYRLYCDKPECKSAARGNHMKGNNLGEKNKGVSKSEVTKQRMSIASVRRESQKRLERNQK